MTTQKDDKYCKLFYAIFSYAIKDLNETFEYVLSTLTEREVMALKLRFVDNLTFREIGETLEPKVSAQRATQIVEKAIRKMCHPNRLNCIRYDKHEYEQILSMKEKIKQENISATVKRSSFLDTPIDEMNLSVRTYNCLKKSGRDTLYDLMNLTEEDLMNIRNIGRKTADEIISRMAEFGVNLKSIDDQNNN